MKKKLHSLISTLLITALILPFASTSVYAQNSDALVEVQESTSTPELTPDTAPEDVIADQESTEEEPVVEENSDLEIDPTVPSNNESIVPEDATDTETAETLSATPVPEIQYFYVESPYLSTPDTQNIVLSITDNGEALSDVTLLFSDESGNTQEMKCVQNMEDLYQFSRDFTDTETGIYHFTSFYYFVNGEQKAFNFEDFGISAYFGVNEDCSFEDKSEHIEMTADNADVVTDDVASDVVIDSDTSTTEVANLVSEALETASQEVEYTEEDEASLMTSAISLFSLADTPSTMSLSPTNLNTVVVLDPGHDSKHAGARSGSYYEEVLTLQIAQECKKVLEQYPGITVYMTRETAACPFPNSTSNIDDIAKRVEWAKSKNADVFISFHLNSSSSSAAVGAEVYYSIGSNEGKNISEKIQAELVALGLKNRGIQEADYKVNTASAAAGFPGLIIEHAFLSNPTEAAKYLSGNGPALLGQADAAGIIKYLNVSKNTYFQTVNGKTYYYLNGQKVYGEKYANGAWRYFDPNDGGAMAIGWCNHSGNKYYYDSNGAMIHGEKYISGFWYYFDENYGKMVTGWATHHGHTYYYDTYGHMQYGEKYISGFWYYFATGTGIMATGLTTHHNNTYYYNSKGQMQYDEKYINGYWYYFRTDLGTMATGLTVHHGHTYYYNSKGQMQYGEAYVSGGWRYFLPGTGIMVTGWCEHHDNKYYYDANGCMVHGKYVIDGTTYYFDTQSGALIDQAAVPPAEKNGLINENGKYYLYQNDQKVLGEKYYEGGWRYFDPNSNGAMAIGWSDHDNHRYYYDQNGCMLHGEYYIDKGWRYFDKNYGYMAIGWSDHDNHRYYYDKNGIMLHGEAYIDKGWRYFDPNYGYMITGWSTHDGGKYYYDASGIMAHGPYVVGGVSYYFDTNSGQLKTCYLNGNMYYDYLGAGKSVSTLFKIEGSSSVTADQLVALFLKKNPNGYPTALYTSGGAPTLQSFCQIYIEECKAENIKPEVAFSQAMVETGWLKFTGVVKPEQFNFAGLGATSSTNPGESYADVRTGIRAQIQHLKAYSSTAALVNPCVDTRFKYVTRNTAPYVEWLGIPDNPYQKGWAAGARYGYTIISVINQIK